MNTQLTEAIGIGFLISVLSYFCVYFFGVGGTGWQAGRQFTISQLAGAILTGIGFGAVWYIRGYHFFSN
jgi:hypothetical protein